VRFVSATNRDLAAAVERGAFRRDLYFRLNGISIVVPPLRERTDEIAALAELFIGEACERFRRGRLPRLSEEALERLRAHAWPGNVRELRSALERAVLFCPGDLITTDHLPDFAGHTPGAPPAGGERDKLLEALSACAGNQTRAARLLGISRNTLLARLDRYGLPRPRKPR
jgi:transcriptional regulator of acetoin/glycerol metabolism